MKRGRVPPLPLFNNAPQIYPPPETNVRFPCPWRGLIFPALPHSYRLGWCVHLPLRRATLVVVTRVLMSGFDLAARPDLLKETM